jgi:hypothetical protein
MSMWSVQFYHQRRGVLADYHVEAPLPPAAVLQGRRALLAAHPRTEARGRLSLFEQADGTEASDGGWVLYRIASLGGQDAPAVVDERRAT